MIEWTADLIGRSGAFGVFILSFLARILPPLPPEAVLPLAGFEAAKGRLSLPLVMVLGTGGQLLALLCWYGPSRRFSRKRLAGFVARHGHWLALTTHDLDRAQDWFDRHGRRAVLIGQLIPAVRTLIAVPAGAFGMPLLPFLATSALGTAVSAVCLILAGYFLEENWATVGTIVSPVGKVVVAGLLLYYVSRLWRHRAGSGR